MDAAGGAAGPGEQAPQPGMWWTRRALALHTTLVVVVPTFIALFWWQVERVREGNTLSWAYVFEWPFFTGYAVYLWWKLVHDQPALADPRPAAAQAPGPPAAEVREAAAEVNGPPAATGPAAATHPQPPGGGGGSEDDEELAAYNRYLADLNASGRRKVW